MRRILKTFALPSALGCLGALAAVAPATGQLPESFENLQVLPEDIEPRALVDQMRSFAGSLGVRCTHCHVGEEGRPLATFDFASDEPEAKRVAREMIRMTQAINQTYLPATERQAVMEVSCYTCHRRLQKPIPLDQELRTVLDAEGADAAVAHYRELRERTYGTGTYDFSERSLRRLGEHLLGDGKPAAAAAMLALNVEQHPESAFSHYLLGEAHLASEDRDAALASYQRALELAPGHPQVRQRLEELQPPGESDPPSDSPDYGG